MSRTDPITTYNRLTGKKPRLDSDIASHAVNAAPHQGKSKAVATAFRLQAARDAGKDVEIGSGGYSVSRSRSSRSRATSSSKKKGCGLLFVLGTVAASVTLLGLGRVLCL